MPADPTQTTSTRRCVLGTTVTSLRETLELIVTSLVDDADAVEITVDEANDPIIYTVHCAADDVRLLIGKSGRTIQAVRTILSAAGAKHDRKVRVEIIEPDVPA